jgi:large subunit ribosomal protein L17
MRHLRKGRKLKRTASHRKALLSNLATSLFKNNDKRIRTTLAKAKEARHLIESLISKAKRAVVGGEDKIVPAKREIYKVIKDREALASIFIDVVPKVLERPGGYTRVVKIGRRLGDAAEMAILELVDFNFAQDKESSTKGKDKKSTTEEDTKKKSEKSDDSQESPQKPAAKKAAPKKTAVKKDAPKKENSPKVKKEVAKKTKTAQKKAK